MKKESTVNKTKDSLKQIIGVVSQLILGGVIGGIIGILLVKEAKNPIIALVYLILFVLIYILQIILHEAGHLIFGLLSGYEFVSFRVGSLTFIREGGKIAIKKFKVIGTGGQCLMMPPEGNGYDCPYVLYNLGGVLMNAIISCLCIVISMLLPYNTVMGDICRLFFITGLIAIALNGIPIKSLGNDGYNLLSIKRSKSERYSFYMILKINGLLHKGVRLKDMPIEWFNLSREDCLEGRLASNLRTIEAGYYEDKKEFNKVREILEDLIDNSNNLGKLLKNELKCELLFCEILGECREEVINELYTKELKKYIKATDCFISRKRLMYAYYLIIEKDNDKANKVLAEVEKVKKTYPVKAEVESELEIIDFIKEKYVLNN